MSSDVRAITVEGLAYALWSLEAPALPDRRWRWLTLDEGTRAQFEMKVRLLRAHAREVHAPSGHHVTRQVPNHWPRLPR